MVSLHINPLASDPLRLGTIALAGVVGLAAVWMLLVDIVRPNLPYFPNDRAAVEAAVAHRTAAGVAAWIGLVRGDLWVDYAMTQAPERSRDIGSATPAAIPEAFDATRAAAVRAIAFAPHDPRAWLLLAAIDARLDFSNHKVAGPLKMSYYTGPNEIALIPLRILVATGSNAIADADIQILVGSEIRTIITRKPESKMLILAAYRNALPEGKRVIEATVGEFDPALLTALRTTTRPGRTDQTK